MSCATIPVEYAESIMFGHESAGRRRTRTRMQGSSSRPGRHLFLDEVSALPLACRASFFGCSRTAPIAELESPKPDL